MQALLSNTTASNNTAVGYQAGYSNTTSGNNTYLGHTAGYSNSTSLGNTFVGFTAGYSTTGNYNTFVGNSTNYGAGYLVTSGSKNTIIGGYNGNQGGLDIRTSDNNIVLSDGDGNVRAYADSTGNWKTAGVVKQGVLNAYTASATVGSDAYCVVFYGAGGTATLTLPTPAANAGRSLWVNTYTSRAVVSATSNVTSLTGAVTTSILPATAGSWVFLFCDGSYWVKTASS
jgi:hypothetical protein